MSGGSSEINKTNCDYNCIIPRHNLESYNRKYVIPGYILKVMEMAQPGVLRKGSWKFRLLGSVIHASKVKIFKQVASSTGTGSLELGFICLVFSSLWC